MTPAQLARRQAVFADLTKGQQEALAEVLTQPDTTNYERSKLNAEYYAERGEKMLTTDSRFSHIWYRILAHIASDETAKRRSNNLNRLIGYAEESLECWEAYAADLIWRAEVGDEYVEAAYARSCGFPLF